MTPALFNSDNEQKVIGTIAMLTAGVIESKVAAVIAGVPEDSLYKAMAMPEVQAAVDVEIARLRLSGELASLKAATLTEAMLSKLLDTPEDEISTGLAIKLAEMGLKFKEKPLLEIDAEAGFSVTILKEGDPEPKPRKNGSSLVIRFGTHKAAAKNITPSGVIDAE
jgi:hypothetical protein